MSEKTVEMIIQEIERLTNIHLEILNKKQARHLSDLDNEYWFHKYSVSNYRKLLSWITQTEIEE